MEIGKGGWMIEHSKIIPYCFDYKEQTCCHTCEFKYCKFYKGVKDGHKGD